MGFKIEAADIAGQKQVSNALIYRNIRWYIQVRSEYLNEIRGTWLT